MHKIPAIQTKRRYTSECNTTRFRMNFRSCSSSATFKFGSSRLSGRLPFLPTRVFLPSLCLTDKINTLFSGRRDETSLVAIKFPGCKMRRVSHFVARFYGRNDGAQSVSVQNQTTAFPNKEFVYAGFNSSAEAIRRNDRSFRRALNDRVFHDSKERELVQALLYRKQVVVKWAASHSPILCLLMLALCQRSVRSDNIRLNIHEAKCPRRAK